MATKKSSAATAVSEEEKKLRQSDELVEKPAWMSAAEQGAASEGTAYKKALTALSNVESAAPVYQSGYDEELDGIYKQITGRGAFKYELGSDPLYRQLREQYTALGLDAMRDAQGQAAALTGGYGSSFAQSAGQQQYDSYLRQLAGEAPELYSAARSAYDAEGERLEGIYSLTRQREGDEYARYSDDYSRYLAERGYLSDKAESEYGKTLSEAQLLSQYGDFGSYGELYGEDKAKLMFDTWSLANPALALRLGLIDEERYRQLVGYGQKKDPNAGRYNSAVAKQQQELRDAGHTEVEVDGILGPITRAAQKAEDKKNAAKA